MVTKLFSFSPVTSEDHYPHKLASALACLLLIESLFGYATAAATVSRHMKRDGAEAFESLFTVLRSDSIGTWNPSCPYLG